MGHCCIVTGGSNQHCLQTAITSQQLLTFTLMSVARDELLVGFQQNVFIVFTFY